MPLATFPDVPTTLAEFIAHRDWVELKPNELVVINDFIVLTNPYLSHAGTIIQCDGWSYTRPTVGELQKQDYKYRACHVFRRTLGTIMNPYRCEHYVDGLLPEERKALCQRV